MAIKAIIFDLDGVLYLGNKVIEGAPEAISELRKKKIKLFFLTNAGTLSRKARAKKLRELGIHARKEEVYTSSFGVADYISKQNPHAKVFYIGEKGIGDELKEKGLSISEEHPDFVIVGLDRKINYKKLSIAFRSILSGAKFIATNTDNSFPVEDGLLPGAGTFVRALEYGTKIQPYIIGKPNDYLVRMILEKCNCKKEEIALVGDRLETDILMANSLGIKSVLVLTGIAKKEDLVSVKKEEKPMYVLSSVSEIPIILNQ